MQITDTIVQAVQDDASRLELSAKSGDAGLLRVSSVNPYTYTRIALSAQTTVKSGAGTLHGVTATTNNVSALALYDNTISGGTTIATLPTSALSNGPWYQFDVNFTTGLTVSSGSTNTDVVISYI